MNFPEPFFLPPTATSCIPGDPGPLLIFPVLRGRHSADPGGIF